MVFEMKFYTKTVKNIERSNFMLHKTPVPSCLLFYSTTKLKLPLGSLAEEPAHPLWSKSNQPSQNTGCGMEVALEESEKGKELNPFISAVAPIQIEALGERCFKWRKTAHVFALAKIYLLQQDLWLDFHLKQHWTATPTNLSQHSQWWDMMGDAVQQDRRLQETHPPDLDEGKIANAMSAFTKALWSH